MNWNPFFSVFLLVFGSAYFSAQKSYNTLVYEGNQEFNKKNYESSSAKYSEAAKLNEKDFTAHYNLGNSFYKRKMYEEAKAEFEKADKLSTNISDKTASLYNMGNVYMQTNDSEKAAELYKKALKQDPYNETIRKNYEIAKLKEKEKQQQENKKNNSEGNGEKDKNKEQKQGDNPQNQSGSNQQNKGDGEGNEPNQNENDNSDKIPKEIEDVIFNRVENKERETAKRILNKNSYSMPQSNDKDW